MQYRVIWAIQGTLSASIIIVEQKVKQYFAEGWKPQGGITVAAESRTGYSTEYVVCQAMIKEEQE